MSINKYSSPEEVVEFFPTTHPATCLDAHIAQFYPDEQVGSGLRAVTLAKIVRNLVTKAMEAL